MSVSQMTVGALKKILDGLPDETKIARMRGDGKLDYSSCAVYTSHSSNNDSCDLGECFPGPSPEPEPRSTESVVILTFRGH